MSKGILGRLPYVILSIAIALLIWVYVDYETNDTYTTWITNIPITYDGEENLENRGLMIIHDESQQTLNLKVSGKRATIMKLSRSNITITVKTSQITGPGELELEYTISYPKTVTDSSITLVSKSSDTASVTVMAETTATIPVYTSFTGSIANGYRAGELTCSPDEITVSGPMEVVQSIAYALVTYGEEDISGSVLADVSYVLMDEEDNPVDTSSLTCSTDTVEISMNVGQTKTVPLTVTIVEGGGATTENAVVEISPASITISGDSDTLAEMDAIDLGTVNLTEILNGTSYTKDINLPSTVENITGTTQATVTVSIEGLQVSTFNATQFNVLNRPEGYTVTVVTETLVVTLRGTAEELAKISAEDIIVAVDLSSVDTSWGSTGAITVSAEVYVSGDTGVGAVGSYNVVVDVE